MHFGILNRSGVDYECDRQTHRRTDGKTEPLLAVARSKFMYIAGHIWAL